MVGKNFCAILYKLVTSFYLCKKKKTRNIKLKYLITALPTFLPVRDKIKRITVHGPEQTSTNEVKNN